MKTRLVHVLAVVLAVGLLSGCASTSQARRATPAGFLGDYSQLKKGGKGQALLIYVNRQVDFKKYHGIIMDPVQVYVSDANSKLGLVPKEDLQRMVNYLDSKVRTLLEKDFTVVETPGPGVVRLRLAITEAKGANVVMNTVSSLVPVGLAISEVKNIAVGSHSAVGAAGIECEVLDAQTGERLSAIVDRRVGGKLTGKFDKWSTADEAFDYWAETIRQRLLEERGKP
jgi:hypothetical protein